MFGIRPLPATLGLSLVVLAVIAPLSTEGPRRSEAVSPARVSTAALGSRVTVLGLVGDLRAFPDGGSAAAITDCRGASADAYFPPGVDPPPAWTVALVEGVVQLYDGRRELRAQSVSGALDDGEGAEQVSAAEIAADPARYACRAVAFSATVRSSSSVEGVAEAHLSVEAGEGTIDCDIHLAAPTAVHVAPGARVTLIGVPAVGPDGRATVHVRA